MSLAKYSRTAVSVPICVTAVNAAPGSVQPKTCEKISRWALLEIGRNSVRPCRTPRMTACAQVIGSAEAVSVAVGGGRGEGGHGGDHRDTHPRARLGQQLRGLLRMPCTCASS